MAKYKVCYEGFAYVEADSEEEAKELFEDEEEVYREQEVTTVKEVDDFLVTIQLSNVYGQSYITYSQALGQARPLVFGKK